MPLFELNKLSTHRYKSHIFISFPRLKQLATDWPEFITYYTIYGENEKKKLVELNQNKRDDYNKNEKIIHNLYEVKIFIRLSLFYIASVFK
jgi:hypothetical protein